jgi:rhodanese-related sulfurtransferase
MTQTISAQQAFEWLKNGEALLIDVREPDEFTAEHIAYASLLPLGMVGDVLRNMDIPAGRKLVFQCKKGMRGGQACDVVAGMAHLQNVDIYNIAGGIESWKTAGLPVIGGSGGRKISIFRQVQMIIGAVLFVLIVLGLTGIGAALLLAAVIAGVFAFTGLICWCGLALLLQKMPWNR